MWRLLGKLFLPLYFINLFLSQSPPLALGERTVSQDGSVTKKHSQGTTTTAAL